MARTIAVNTAYFPRAKQARFGPKIIEVQKLDFLVLVSTLYKNISDTLHTVTETNTLNFASFFWRARPCALMSVFLPLPPGFAVLDVGERVPSVPLTIHGIC